MDFSEDFTDSLVFFLVLHKELGLLEAKLNWLSCRDPDSLTKSSLNMERRKRSVLLAIEKRKAQFEFSLNDADFNTLLIESMSFKESFQEQSEQDIEVEHRPTAVYFNKEALVIHTETPIPLDIQIGLSFGYKFLFPYAVNNKNMHEILAQLELCMADSLTELRLLEASAEIHRIFKSRKQVQEDDNKIWLAFVILRTQNFFKLNNHIFATKSDKGGHTVVLNVADYDSKLQSHLDNGEYTPINHDPLQDLVESETYFYSLFKKNKKLKDLIIENKLCFQPNTLHLPKFYGLPKIHKEGLPLRPITSTCGATGYFVAKLFDLLLNEVFPRSDLHIRDIFEFNDYLNRHSADIRNRDDYILVSFDVVSMFSTIPFELVFDIIMSKANSFEDLFLIDRFTLRKLIFFLLKKCMVFSALGKTYKQTEGLPMGSCTSPTIARIVMDQVITDLLEKVPHIQFVKVYVDDTIALIHKDYVNIALETLNNFRAGQIKFTLELENDHASINFLNLTLYRDGDTIITNWFRKSFASGRLLNYFSSHKRTTVLATAVHFIKTVLQLSNPQFFHKNKEVIFDTLRDNSFPETLIEVLLNEHYTYMKPIKRPIERKPLVSPLFNPPNDSPLVPANSVENGHQNVSESPYVIFPHSICEGRNIKRVLHTLKNPGVIFTDSVKNTKLNGITTRKTITPIEQRNNLILSSMCQCGEKCVITHTKYNETGQIAHDRIFTSNKHSCDSHGHAYLNIQFHRGLAYGSQTQYLCRYVQWMHRHKIDAYAANYEYPIEHLGKLIQCSCCSANSKASSRSSSHFSNELSRSYAE